MASIRALVLQSLLFLASTASATVHHLFVGSFSTSRIYAAAFDDQALTLSLVNNISAYSEHLWLAFDHNKENLYAAANTSWASYQVSNSTSLTFETAVAQGGNCSSAKDTFIAGAEYPPYAVYASPFGSCGNVLSISESGTLQSVIQNYTYDTNSGVHGTAFSPDGKFLYSADDEGNQIWTHKIDNSTGAITAVSSISGPDSGDDPRHVAVHPNGQYVYTVYESGNSVGAYKVNNSTGELTYADTSFSLLPSEVTGSDNSSYWSDDVRVSYSSQYLFASVRGRNTNTTGYISAFSLDASGAIKEQLFLTSTSTSGGTANAITPAYWTDDWIALTDSEVGFVEIWKFSTGVNASASVVARLDLDDGGCCANAVWYD